MPHSALRRLYKPTLAPSSVTANVSQLNLRHCRQDGKTVALFLKKSDIKLADNPVVPPPRSLPEKWKHMGTKWKQHTKTYRPIHSSIIHLAPKWKQPKCPSAGEWIKRMWFIHKKWNADVHNNAEKP